MPTSCLFTLGLKVGTSYGLGGLGHWGLLGSIRVYCGLIRSLPLLAEAPLGYRKKCTDSLGARALVKAATLENFSLYLGVQYYF